MPASAEDIPVAVDLVALSPSEWLDIGREAAKRPTPADRECYALCEPVARALVSWGGMPMPDDPAARRALVAQWEIRHLCRARQFLTDLSRRTFGGIDGG